MTKRTVLLIAIVGVLCFSLWGYMKPVQAATSITWVMQNPTEPIHSKFVTVWASSNTSPGDTAILEYRINDTYTKVNGIEDVDTVPGANWKFIVPGQVQGVTVSYQLLYRNADNSLGGHTGFNWSYTVKVLNATVDSSFEEGTPGFGKTAFATIQTAVTSVDAGAVIQVNLGTYSGPITINKPLTIRGVGSYPDVPLITGKIILASQGTTLGLIKIFNLRFAIAQDAITIGDLSDASFDQVELNNLTFGTTAVFDSRAIKTTSSVQIVDLRILTCTIFAAHGITLNGDIGAVVISDNTFNLTGQTDGHFDAITINQDTKAVDSIKPTGSLTIQRNTLTKPVAEVYPFTSAILNQATFVMTSTADGKKLSASGNTFGAITDQTQFIQDKIADFVPVNTAPVAQDQTLTTAEDTNLAISLVASDAEDDELTYTLLTSPEHGTFSGSIPNLTYAPDANYYGSDSFTYIANDGELDSNTATVSITITAVNDAPVTLGQSTTTTEDTEINIILDAADVDSENLTFIIVTSPNNGSATLLGNVVSYEPTANYSGLDSFTYKANDGLADSNASPVTVTISEVNDAPALTAITAKTVNEGEALSFTAIANDVDLPAQKLSFSLVDAPSGAAIDAVSGVFNWTPTEDQGPHVYAVKVCVSDGAVETSACQDVAVMVNEVNLQPTLITILAKAVNEGETLNFTAAAGDEDLPAQSLSFSLVDAPTGADIDAVTGVFNWTPSEDQGPHSCTVNVCISDGVATPTCQDVTVTVNEVNLPPVLNSISDQTAIEAGLLTFTASGSDGDLPEQTLIYSLEDAPTGAVIDPTTGVFTWTPSEGQESLTYYPSVCVSDGVVATPSCQEVTITVEGVNTEPTMETIAAQSINEGEQLSFTVIAVDADLPTQTLSFSLVDAPNGAAIDAGTGAFSWTPTEVQGPQIYEVKVCVNDGIVLTPTCQDVAVTVNEVNQLPALTTILAKAINEGEDLSFTVEASDEDLPAQPLSFSLVDAPNGAIIDAGTGAFTWTPTEAQGPQEHTIKICVSDGTVETPTCQEVAVTVNEVNLMPTLTTIPAKAVNEGEALSFTVAASDEDLPAQELTFSLVDIPTGACIDAITGAFSWTPSEDQGPQYHTVKVCVSDGVATPTCQDVAATVNEINLPPVLNAISDQTAIEAGLLTFTASGSDGDLPAQTLIFSLVNAPSGAEINPATGEFTWIPGEGQGEQTYKFSVCVSDGVAPTPSCQEVGFTVDGVNGEPTLETITSQTINEGELLTFTAEASDTDLPAQELTYSLQDAPAGAVIDPSTGVFNWTPGVGQGLQNYIVKVCVSDGTLFTCQEVSITVVRAVIAPLIKIYLPLISR